MSDYKRKYATIWLPYFDQGDDLSGCIVKDENGIVDTKETIQNHISLLQSVIDVLQEICDTIPDVNSCVIDGNIHHIGIEGDEQIINELASKNLVTIDEFYNEEVNFDDEDESDNNSHNIESADTEIIDSPEPHNDSNPFPNNETINDNAKLDNDWYNAWMKLCNDYDNEYTNVYGNTNDKTDNKN